jgi:ABC-type multidrug transport system permease subunit
VAWFIYFEIALEIIYLYILIVLEHADIVKILDTFLYSWPCNLVRSLFFFRYEHLGTTNLLSICVLYIITVARKLHRGER